MKKLLLLASICLIGISASFAEGDPAIIVRKYNGGWWAWLNLYNRVEFTPSQNGAPAILDCSGKGFTFCRVPSAAFSFVLGSTNNGTVNMTPQVNSRFADAVNELIEQSENSSSKGVNSGMATKKIAVQSSSKKVDTYVVKGQWSYNQYGEGTIMIYIDKLNLLQRQ